MGERAPISVPDQEVAVFRLTPVWSGREGAMLNEGGYPKQKGAEGEEKGTGTERRGENPNRSVLLCHRLLSHNPKNTIVSEFKTGAVPLLAISSPSPLPALAMCWPLAPLPVDAHGTRPRPPPGSVGAMPRSRYPRSSAGTYPNRSHSE